MTPMIIKIKPIKANKLGHWLYLNIPKIVVAIIHNPANVAYVYPAEIVFITCDKQYMQSIIVKALNKEGKSFVKPSASLAKIFDAVPNATAEIKKV